MRTLAAIHATGGPRDAVAEALARVLQADLHFLEARPGATKQALTRARDEGYDRLLTLDGDLGHAPADAPRLLEGLRAADLVVGSRYAPGGEDARPLAAASRVANLALGLALGVGDPGSRFLALGRHVVELIDPAVLTDDDDLASADLVARARRAGLEVVELPIAYRGPRPRRIVRTAASALAVVGARWRGDR